MSRLLVLLGLFVYSSHVASGANILFFQPISSYSHRMIMWPLVNDLLQAGHSVTGISQEKMEASLAHPNFTDIVPQLWISQLGDWSGRYNFVEMRKTGGGWVLWKDLIEYGILACESLYDDEEFLKWLLQSKFDLVVVDVDFNECIYGMIQHFWPKSKMIIYSTSGVMGYFMDQFGLPDESSSVTEHVIGFPLGMSFKQRFMNGMIPLIWKVARDFYYFPQLEKVTKNRLNKITGKEVEVGSFSKFERERTSLLFVTSHFSFSYPRSLPPNHVEILKQLPEKVEPLPKEIEAFIGSSPFIFVSLGSIVEFTRFPKDVQRRFISAIEHFPNVKFIWKEGKEAELELPKNVMVLKWAPQLSLLAHKNIKAFITHSGMGSTTEAIYFGVPTVMFPVYVDQDSNAGFVESKGAGITLEISDISEISLRNAINEVLSNPSYSGTMKSLSIAFRDLPMPPRKTAFWWTEWILKHNESVHEFLKPPSVGQSWWVRRQIDVWLVATLLVTIIVIFPVYILLKILACLCASPKQKRVTKEKKIN